MSNKKQSAGILYDAALLLIALALLSSCFASGLFAKFVSGSEGAGGARVAQWSVDADAGATIEILPAGDGNVTYPITFKSISETAVSFDVEITFAESMAAVFETPRLAGNAPEEGASFTDTLTFTGVATLPASQGVEQQSSENFTFHVRAAYMSLIGASADDYDNEIVNGANVNIPFTVTVRAVQVD